MITQDAPAEPQADAATAAPLEPAQAGVERMSIDSLHVDPANVRVHDERSKSTIRASLARFGAGRSIVLDRNNVVRAGNGTLEQARALGFEEVLVVEPKPNQLLAVKRSDWTDTVATAYSVQDNRSTDLSRNDDAALAATLEAVRNEDASLLEATGYTGDEVDELLRSLADNMLANGEASEIQEGPKVFSNEHIIEAAFRWFRKAGFPYRNLPVHVSMQELNKLARTDPESLLQTDTAYHVADTYHFHRWEGSDNESKSPLEAFLDDRVLRRALKLDLEQDGVIRDGMPHHMVNVSGTQCHANFRPGFACKLYRDYCQPGDTVLDTSTGYGGRLVGFMASGIAGLYIGIDPSTKTHAGNERMAQEIGFADKVELWNLPAEDMQHAELAERCDFAFTSPPYFSKEHYSEEPTQSWKRYPSGDSWREGFLLPMFELQFAALKPGKFSVVNIADVKIKSKVYPLASWAVTCAEQAGFKFIRTDEFPMQRRFGAGHDDEVATEPVLVFQKP